MSALLSLSFWMSVGIVAAAYAIFTLGLQANTTFGGVLNFGQAGFAAVGAYTMAILIIDLHWNPVAALAAAVAAAVAVGLLVALPSMRLARDYLAMVTLAVAELVQSIGQNAQSLTGGNTGLTGFSESWSTLSTWIVHHLSPPGFESQNDWPLLVLSWIVLALAAIFMAYLRKTPWGRIARAIREDEDPVRAVGKNVYLYKIESLVLAASLAALAAFIVSLNVTVVYPLSFSADFTFIGFAILALGGFGSFRGVIVGSVALWAVMQALTFVPLPISADRVAALQMLIVGAILVGFIAFRPQGVFGRAGEMARLE